MSAADSRAPRLAGASKSPWQRARELVSSWRSPADPLLALAIDNEIENHILERAERLMEDEGMSEREALREAERRFGDVRRVRRSLERLNDAGGGPGGGEFFRSVLRDLKLGWRSVVRNPGFAMAVVVTIGLGVGANAAVFSVTDAVLLRPLPYEDPDQLVAVEAYYPESDRTLDRMPAEQALAWQEPIAEVGELLLFGRRNLVRTDLEDPYSVVAYAVSADWAATLGVRPHVGRGFAPDEALPGAPQTMILSYTLWRDRFGADRDVIGNTIELDHRPYTVIGVMPRGFKFPILGPASAWVPLRSDGTYDGANPLTVLSLLMRPADGLDADAVQERLDALASGLAAGDPRPDGWQVRARPFDNFRANTDVERALWVLTGAVAVMLLIAVVNATNLFLVRASARRHEIALRVALGASRTRIVRQQLTENLVLVAAGGLLAVALSRLVLDSIVGLLPSEVTFFLAGEIAVNGRVLGFALAATGIAGLLAGLIPAIYGSTTARAAHSSRDSGSRSGNWLRNGLVVAEIAMTVALLVGAGLMINSFLRLTAVDPGYNPATMAQLSISLPPEAYPDSVAQRRFFDDLRDRIAGLPGVTTASLADGVPPDSGFSFGITPQAEGQDPKELPGLMLPFASVDAGFFRALETPIVAGRGFNSEDTEESGHVIVDREMARFFWGQESPIGRRFRLDADDDSRWLTVVGMVDDVKLMGQDDRRGGMDLFYPLPGDEARSFMSIVIRAVHSPEGTLPMIRGAVREIDPDLPIYELTTGVQALAAVNDKPRFFLMMMTIFAAIALGLALIGTYGTLAFTVRQRHRELGVRIALGAGSRAVQGMVLKQGLGLAALGVTLGVTIALGLGGLARSLLFQVEPTDPVTFATVAIVMLSCAAVACWIPARRATRVDPVQVLRAD